ncbi:MAG: flagellar filament capping protein FliD [Eubacteriales bacterium]
MSTSINRLRLSGMSSGFDTESIIAKLTEANSVKVRAATQQKILLEWKQEAYKSVINKLSAFQTKYFSSSSASGISNSIKQLTADFTSPYISVTPGSSQTAGNIYIKDIVSLASSAKLSGGSAVSDSAVIGVNTDALSGLSGKSMSITLDGVEKTITFSSNSHSNAGDVAVELSSLLNSAFGSGKISVVADGNNLKLDSQYSTILLKMPQDSDADPSAVLTYSPGTSNRIDLNSSLSAATFISSPFESAENPNLQFKINGKLFSFSGNNTLAGIINSVNSSSAGVKMSYSSLTDTFSLTSSETGSSSSVTIEDVEGSLMGTLFASQSYTQGTDAVVRLSTNGSHSDTDIIEITRSSNSFNVNGSIISILGKASGETSENIDISFNYDASAALEKIKSFVSDYNELLSSLTSQTYAERYKDFLPLTDDQKSDMKDSEIALWTEKAKSGLLRNDTYLKNIENELRSSMFSVVNNLNDTSGAGISLSEIGITTGLYSDKGKLLIDETKLKNLLSENPDQVIKAFSQKSNTSFSVYATEESQKIRFSESGVLDRINDIISKNLNKSGKKGALIYLVGNPNDSYSVETDYSKRIKNAVEKIENLEERLADVEERYWNQFTAMEKALATMNSQSEWLSKQFNN